MGLRGLDFGLGLTISALTEKIIDKYFQEKPKLYTYFRSSCSWRVRIALNITGVEVDMEPVHLVKGVQRSDEYREVNPMGQVPALVIDDMTLTQSVAIMEYLHDTHPEAKLLPTNPKERAKVRMLTEVIASGTQPIQVYTLTESDAFQIGGKHKVTHFNVTRNRKWRSLLQVL